MALEVAGGRGLEVERAEVLLAMAKRARGSARTRLAHEALARLEANASLAEHRAGAIPFLPPPEALQIVREAATTTHGAELVGSLLPHAPLTLARQVRALALAADGAPRAALLAGIAVATGEPSDVAKVLPTAIGRALEVGDDFELLRLAPHLGLDIIEALRPREDRLSFEVRKALARRLVARGIKVDAALELAHDEGERRLTLAELLPLAPDAPRRGARVARWLARLPEGERPGALVTLGTSLARVGHGAALVPFAVSPSAALALARGDRACARALASQLVDWAVAEEGGWLLLALGPISGAFAWRHLHRLIAVALEGLARELPGATLAGDGMSVRTLTSLFAHVAGDAGLLFVGRAAVGVAHVFW